MRTCEALEVDDVIHTALMDISLKPKAKEEVKPLEKTTRERIEREETLMGDRFADDPVAELHRRRNVDGE